MSIHWQAVSPRSLREAHTSCGLPYSWRRLLFSVKVFSGHLQEDDLKMHQGGGRAYGPLEPPYQPADLESSENPRHQTQPAGTGQARISLTLQFLAGVSASKYCRIFRHFQVIGKIICEDVSLGKLSIPFQIMEIGVLQTLPQDLQSIVSSSQALFPD